MPRHWIDKSTGELCVEVCQFTFRFRAVGELQEAADFYRSKTHPSSRLPRPEDVSREAARDPKRYRASIGKFMRSHHAEVQRWYERVPLRLQQEGKRQKVVKALEKALIDLAPK